MEFWRGLECGTHWLIVHVFQVMNAGGHECVVGGAAGGWSMTGALL